MTNQAYYTVASAAETESDVEGPVFNEENNRHDAQAGTYERESSGETRCPKRQTTQQRNYRLYHRSRSPLFKDPRNTYNGKDVNSRPSNLEDETADETDREGRSK